MKRLIFLVLLSTTGAFADTAEIPKITHKIEVLGEVSPQLSIDREYYSESNTFRVPELTIDGWGKTSLKKEDLKKLVVDDAGQFSLQFKTQNKNALGVDFALILFRLHIKKAGLDSASITVYFNEDCSDSPVDINDITGTVVVKKSDSGNYLTTKYQLKDGSLKYFHNLCLPIKEGGSSKLKFKILYQ